MAPAKKQGQSRAVPGLPRNVGGRLVDRSVSRPSAELLTSCYTRGSGGMLGARIWGEAGQYVTSLASPKQTSRSGPCSHDWEARNHAN